MHRNEWVENADRWVAGFLEMFEEGCHKMVSHFIHNQLMTYALICHIAVHGFGVLTPWFLSLLQGTAIRDRIQERLRGQPRDLLENGEEDDDDEEYFYEDDDDEEEYYDDDEYYDEEDEKKR